MPFGSLPLVVVQWLNNPDALVSDQERTLIEKHDKSCTSLTDLWLPRRTGRTCPSDLTDCDGCGLTFYNEGVYKKFEDCPESWH